MPKLSMVEGDANHGDSFGQKYGAAGVYVRRPLFFCRLESINDERAMDRSSCRGAGAGAQSE
jgi:hypothetical protein